MSRLGDPARPPLAQHVRAFEDIAVAAEPELSAGASNVTILQPAQGNASERLGRRFGDRAPVLVFALTLLAGYLAMAALAIGLGFLLVDVLVPIHAVGHSDNAVNDWFASHRSGSLDDASYIGSSIGDIPFIPALVILTVLAAAFRRRWRVAAFMAGAILVEVATYRVASLVVHRDRPAVPRLDDLPVNQSYPSGHVAASVVVYVGLALLISSHLPGGRSRAVLWAAALALPLVVAVSRMYRGMHHPLDVSAGVLIGVASIAIALFATRAAVEAARLRCERGRA